MAKLFEKKALNIACLFYRKTKKTLIPPSKEILRDSSWKGELSENSREGYEAPTEYGRGKNQWEITRIVRAEIMDGKEGFWVRFVPSVVTAKRRQGLSKRWILDQQRLKNGRWVIFWADQWFEV